MLECVHAIPGRVRFRVPQHKLAALAPFAERLGALDGVTRVEMRPRAASLVVHYDPARLGLARLLDLGGAASPSPAASPARTGAKSGTVGQTPAPAPHCLFTQAVRRLGVAVGGVAGSYLLERAVKAGMGTLLRAARLPI